MLTASVFLACTGISATIGMAVLTLRDWPGRRHLWGLAIIPALGVLYIPQQLNGLNMLASPKDISAVHFQALLVIVFFMIAIARAWQMIGARNTAWWRWWETSCGNEGPWLFQTLPKTAMVTSPPQAP